MATVDKDYGLPQGNVEACVPSAPLSSETSKRSKKKAHKAVSTQERRVIRVQMRNQLDFILDNKDELSKIDSELYREARRKTNETFSKLTHNREQLIDAITLKELARAANAQSIKLDDMGRRFDFDSLRNTLKERYDRLTANNLILGSSLSLNTNSQESIFDENFYKFRWKIDLIGNILRLFLKSINANQNETNYYTLGGVSPSQYIKTEIDYIKHWSLGRERIFAFHAFTGIAIPYGNSSNVPFARSYFSGGSNDNRAWRAYELGPGSSNNINEFNEANFKLAFNLEYRFPISGPLNGGLFIDIGNIWNLWDNVNDTALSFSGLKDLNELAIGSGFGLRYDLDFFVFRFDTGFKTYNPALSVGQRWWSEFNLRNAVLNIGINYPF